MASMDNCIDLAGKNALVTGGSRGIGADICKKMAICGANILINYNKSSSEAKELSEELEKLFGIQAPVFQADISQEEEVNAMFNHFDQTLGDIDVLVNNAGFENVEHAIDLDLKDWDQVININLRGAFVCSQQAGRRMVENGSGSIINISSIHDKVPRKGLIHYCCSKAAMKMMTKCLALELAEHNIKVVTVSPGAIETEMNREEIEKFGRDKFQRWIPQGKVGKVSDVSWTCAFLASDMSSYYTGTELYIDGGYKESTIQYDPRPKRD